MHHKVRPYARKLRQLNYAIKQARALKIANKSTPRELLARIEKLIHQIRYQLKGPRIAKVLSSAALVLGLSTQAQAQTPTYLPGVEDPFGLEGLHQFPVGFKKASFGDIDGDGDLDMVFSLADQVNHQTFIAFCTNVGNAENPFFIAPAFDLYGTGTLPNFFGEKTDYADLDNDGDLDLVTFGFDSTQIIRFAFYENIGSVNAPAFAAPQLNVFGLDANESFQYLTSYGDLDNDGDLDILAQAFGPGAFSPTFVHYYQNTSTGNTTSFQGPSIQPFNFSSPDFDTYNFLMDLVDIDGDGDLDLSAQVELEGAAPGDPDIQTFGTIENFGSINSPAFSPPDTLLFSVPGLGDISAASPFTMVDLDNDGDLDIVATHEYDVTLYYENVQTTSTEEVIGQPNQVSLSPNPTNGLVRIESAQALRSIEVIEISGRSLEIIDGSITSLDLSPYPAGVYLLKMTTTDDRVLMRKVRKQ